jgi:hypothetical protein
MKTRTTEELQAQTRQVALTLRPILEDLRPTALKFHRLINQLVDPTIQCQTLMDAELRLDRNHQGMTASTTETTTPTTTFTSQKPNLDNQHQGMPTSNSPSPPYVNSENSYVSKHNSTEQCNVLQPMETLIITPLLIINLILVLVTLLILLAKVNTLCSRISQTERDLHKRLRDMMRQQQIQEANRIDALTRKRSNSDPRSVPRPRQSWLTSHSRMINMMDNPLQEIGKLIEKEAEPSSNSHIRK